LCAVSFPPPCHGHVVPYPFSLLPPPLSYVLGTPFPPRTRWFLRSSLFTRWRRRFLFKPFLSPLRGIFFPSFLLPLFFFPISFPNTPPLSHNRFEPSPRPVSTQVPALPQPFSLLLCVRPSATDLDHFSLSFTLVPLFRPLILQLFATFPPLTNCLFFCRLFLCPNFVTYPPFFDPFVRELRIFWSFVSHSLRVFSQIPKMSTWVT